MCRCVRGILRRSAWAAALTVALVSASPSNAGTLTVDFSLAGSSLVLGPVSVSNGMGAMVSGTARVVLTGVDASGMSLGGMSNGTVSNLALNFMVNTPLVAGLDASLVGPISITQMGSSSGPFNGSQVALATGTFNTNLAVNLNCVGMQCALVSQLGMITFPIMQMAAISNGMAPFPVGLAGLGGSATLNAVVMQMNAGQAVTLTFSGSEVARTFVPEPVEAGMLILGVLALCGLAAVRRQTA